MPKETIQFAMFEDAFDDVEMSVNWSKEEEGGWVQVGMTRHQQPAEGSDTRGIPRIHHTDHSACSTCPVDDLSVQVAEVIGGQAVFFRSPSIDEITKGRASLPELPPHGDPDPAGVATVWSAPMRRDQINRMIKSLRRARDQAFGPDE